jgi:hypothetical protein
VITSSAIVDLRKREGGVMTREVDREVLVLDTESNLIHKLNQTASFIWRALDTVRSSDEVARMLANEYEVEEHVAVRDVVDTVHKLLQLKLVVVA